MWEGFYALLMGPFGSPLSFRGTRTHISLKKEPLFRRASRQMAQERSFDRIGSLFVFFSFYSLYCYSSCFIPLLYCFLFPLLGFRDLVVVVFFLLLLFFLFLCLFYAGYILGFICLRVYLFTNLSLA